MVLLAHRYKHIKNIDKEGTEVGTSYLLTLYERSLNTLLLVLIFFSVCVREDYCPTRGRHRDRSPPTSDCTTKDVLRPGKL